MPGTVIPAHCGSSHEIRFQSIPGCVPAEASALSSCECGVLLTLSDLLVDVEAGSLLCRQDGADQPEEWKEETDDTECDVSLLKRQGTDRKEAGNVKSDENDPKDPLESGHDVAPFDRIMKAKYSLGPE
jgi:hypothetical protein